MLGPFTQPIFNHNCISPPGKTEKKVTGKSGLFRTCQHHGKASQ